MIVPTCNLSDREGAVTEEQLKAQQQRIKKLENPKIQLKEKVQTVQEIYIPTVKSPS